MDLGRYNLRKKFTHRTEDHLVERWDNHHRSECDQVDVLLTECGDLACARWTTMVLFNGVPMCSVGIAHDDSVAWFGISDPHVIRFFATIGVATWEQYEEATECDSWPNPQSFDLGARWAFERMVLAVHQRGMRV